MIQLFLTRRSVILQELPHFQNAIRATLRVRNSTAVELALIIVVYTAGQEMPVVHFGKRSFSHLAGVTLAPLLPLALTIFSAEKLILKLITVVL